MPKRRLYLLLISAVVLASASLCIHTRSYEMAHMDKEILLIKSRLDAGQLREWLWPHFVAAA